MEKVEDFLNHVEMLIRLGHIFGRVDMFDDLVDGGYYFHIEISNLLVNFYPRRDKEGNSFYEVEVRDNKWDKQILHRIVKNDDEIIAVKNAIECSTI